MSAAGRYADELRPFYDWLLIERGLSRLTIEAYLGDVGLLLAGLDDAGVDHLTFTAADLNACAARRRDASTETVLRWLCSVRAYCRFLLKSGKIAADPCARLETPRRHYPLPRSLSEDGVRAVLDAPDLDTAAGRRDKAMLETLYGCGLRVSELTGLRFAQLNLLDGMLVIRGKGDKERLVPLGRNAVYWLEYYLRTERAARDPEQHCPYVFLSGKGLRPLTRVAFWYRIKKYVTALGMAPTISPHTFRHAFASHLLNHDADLRAVQLLLGHASLTTTQIYTEVATWRLHEIYERAHPRA